MILTDVLYKLTTEGELVPYDSVVAREPFEVFFASTTEPPAGAYPLWKGLWIDNKSDVRAAYPAFWTKLLQLAEDEKIRVVTNDVYDDEIDTTGECDGYVIDQSNGFVRLPYLTSLVNQRVITGSSSFYGWRSEWDGSFLYTRSSVAGPVKCYKETTSGVMELFTGCSGEIKSDEYGSYIRCIYPSGFQTRFRRESTEDKTASYTEEYVVAYPYIQIYNAPLNISAIAVSNLLDSLGGMKLRKVTQEEYDALETKDPFTLYVITGVA